MKIQEFRDKMKQADREVLEIAAAELYKRIPKQRKEDEVDHLLEELLVHGKPTAKKASSEAIPFERLQNQITLFLEYADNSYYCVPNRVIPKSQRSKWRFEVKNFIKQLDKIPADSPDSEMAAKLYRELYKRLCHGCGYYIFPTEDPFRSVGIGQAEFYSRLISKYFANGYTEEKLKDMLAAATQVFLDRETLYIELESVYIQALRTPDMKELAMKLAKEKIAELEKKLLGMKKSYSTQKYRLQEEIEELSATVLGLGIELSDGEKAAKYYLAHDKEGDREISLYKVLDRIDFYEEPDLWINTYEAAVKRGIKPRESLVREYQKRKND